MIPLLAGMLLGCGPRPADLSAPDPDVRRRSLVAMTPADLAAHYDRVEALALSDPDPAVRREAIRSLGWTRDPRALPVLEGLVGTPWGDAAAEGLLAYGGDACATVEHLVADGWRPGVIGPPDRSRSDAAWRWVSRWPCRRGGGPGR